MVDDPVNAVVRDIATKFAVVVATSKRVAGKVIVPTDWYALNGLDAEESFLSAASTVTTPAEVDAAQMTSAENPPIDLPSAGSSKDTG